MLQLVADASTVWTALGTVGTLIAAIGTVIAVIFAAKSARASERTVATMNDQWQQDRLDRVVEQRLRRISLVSTLYNECDAIKHTYHDGSQAHLAMDEWKKSRAEVALIDEELAGLMRGLEILVERNNGENTMSAETVYGPSLASFRARVAASEPDEWPAIQEEYRTLIRGMTNDAKERFAKALPTVDDAMTRLASIYKALKERA